METRPDKSEMTSDDRLRRVDQQSEEFVQSQEQPLSSLIVIGASAGGHHALQEAVKGLSRDLPAAVIVVLHSGSRTVTGFSLENFLHTFTDLPIQTVQHEERLQGGRMYVVPSSHVVTLHERMLQLQPILPVHPATTINRLFESAATTYHDRVIGVILSGLLRDGTAGLKAVHDAGGITMVQDPAEAEYPDMPQNAMRDLPVTFCLRLAEIGPALDLLARRGTALETGLAASVRMLKERIELFQRLLTQSTRNRSTHQFLTTELATLRRHLSTTQAMLDETLARGGVAGWLEAPSCKDARPV